VVGFGLNVQNILYLNGSIVSVECS